ncbi:protein TBATA [Erpetoichthys calabaricus]|nr:protein TBATA [Erpetoichthys calabaricus]
MAAETKNCSLVVQKQNALKTSVKERMKKIEDPVSSTFNQKQTLKVTNEQNTPSSHNNAVRPASKGTPRFGMLSHHSFFSRHNPHPHRVTHIQGLNGNPVCIVNDDWYNSSPLSPHPLIKSQLAMTVLGVPGLKLPYGDGYGNNSLQQGTALISEAWREELRELAAKVCTSRPQAKEDNKLAEEVRRSTQYSVKTGRIIPPSSHASSRHSSQKRRSRVNDHAPSPAFYDQELIVLELLCQILQTDSLTNVQQWLLSAGQREKDLIMGMIQSAIGNFHFNNPFVTENQEGRFHTQASPPARTSFGQLSTGNSESKKYSTRFYHEKKPAPIAEEERPVHIGTAEVLQVHNEAAVSGTETQHEASAESKENRM